MNISNQELIQTSFFRTSLRDAHKKQGGLIDFKLINQLAHLVNQFPNC